MSTSIDLHVFSALLVTAHKLLSLRAQKLLSLRPPAAHVTKILIVLSLAHSIFVNLFASKLTWGTHWLHLAALVRAVELSKLGVPEAAAVGTHVVALLGFRDSERTVA